MKKVFITRLFPQKAVKILKDSGFSVEMWNSDEPVDYNNMVQKSKDIDGLLCTLSDQINENFFNAARNLKIISTMSVGYDHINLALAKRRDIKIGYTPDVLTDASAELAVGLLLAVSRKLIEGIASVKEGSWGAWKPFWMCGYGLHNSTVGIVGLGNIGKAIVRRLQAFGVKEFIASSSDSAKCGSMVQLGSNLSVKITSFDTLLASADFVLVTCSLNEKTINLFDDSAFSKMKSSAIIVNVSRGAVINQDALLTALNTGKIAGAGLDVCNPEPMSTNHPLLSVSNCIILPHIASATFDTRNSMCYLAVRNLVNGLLGQQMESELKW